jgi:hypothetical protein
MATAQGNTFFLLPPELRFEVYRHLLTNSLASGLTTDIGGLYLSCDAIKIELENSVQDIRPILNIKHGWEAESWLNIVLPFEVPLNWNYTSTLTSLTMAIPVEPMGIPICDGSTPDRMFYVRLLHLLGPVFWLSLSVLTIKMHQLDGCESAVAHNPYSCACFMQMLLEQSSSLSEHLGTIKPLERIDRLVLQFSPVETGAKKWDDPLSFSMNHMVLSQSLSRATRFWGVKKIVDDMEIWSLGFDFKKEMEKWPGQTMDSGNWLDFDG